ncbi:Flagella basal body P-ring formation protein FlgA [Andreprevotia sp. IGB-42]|uniref:flagellar basal body P-ring formation chaperone FlgA n=1 Tax=Andreprevotia sp. IGB-42 TaxID=2497473 RepID=UPI00135A4CF6|nr:flagellar basal body P-ring formation chaperone FlgA [Andreprevotia sp. IGB-42]KAF0813267.1 Flagella basal body P-ring formation protein FlgA [Andreprevotia sp. IGB-42]
MRPISQLFVIATACMAAFSAATAAPAGQELKGIQRAVGDWLDAQLANSQGLSSYQIGQIDTRLKLDACNAFDIQLPNGYRLVGNTMVRVRCVDGAAWGVNVPVKVSIQSTYYVASRPLQAGKEIGPGDLVAQQGDLALLPGSVILDPTQAMGRTLNSAVASGGVVRAEMLRAAMVIQQNQRVKVLYRDGGLEVSNDGTALQAAAEGQVVRVRVGTSQIVQGIARSNGVVEITP